MKTAAEITIGTKIIDREGIDWEVVEIKRERGVMVFSLYNPMMMISRTTCRVRPSSRVLTA
jgi:hypothetical protein